MLVSTKSFVDFDGVLIPVGTEVEAIVRRGTRQGGTTFWNGLLNGKVVFVTVGRPTCFKEKEANQ